MAGLRRGPPGNCFLFQDTSAFIVLIGKIHLEEIGRVGKGGETEGLSRCL